MPPFFCPQLISSKFAFLGLVMQPSERCPPIFVIGFRADLVLKHTHMAHQYTQQPPGQRFGKSHTEHQLENLLRVFRQLSLISHSTLTDSTWSITNE
jgi:hypothetical protein